MMGDSFKLCNVRENKEKRVVKDFPSENPWKSSCL